MGMALACFTRLLLSKSAPPGLLGFDDLVRLFRQGGIKRRAMDIIMASSWAGSPFPRRGDMSCSSPSVRAMGEVVKGEQLGAQHQQDQPERHVGGVDEALFVMVTKDHRTSTVPSVAPVRSAPR